MYTIGALSRATGVKIPTIRFYEEKGLLAPEGRTAGGQRRYDRAGLERLAFIRHGRDLGLPLDAISELISLDPDDHVSTHRIAQTHLAQIKSRIKSLKRLAQELSRIAASCDGGADHDCNVMSALADHTGCNGPHK
ncbi:MAG: MerR family transcriptional regulator [Maritimibacter sp.]